MFFYSPPSLSPGYPSYIPRRSYRPASFYQHDDEPYGLSTLPLEHLAYSPLPATLPPRIDPEMRYRRALHELEAAEQEFEAHVALERTSQVALARQRAADEAARRERARAIQAEVERLERARALQALVEERLAQGQHSSRPRAAFGRAPPPVHDLVRAHVDLGATEDFVPHRRFPGCRRSRSHLVHRPAPRDSEDEDVFSIGDLLKVIAGVHLEPEPASPTQEPTSPAAEPEPKPEPQPQSQPAFSIGDLLKFIAGVHLEPEPASPTQEPTSPTAEPEPKPEPQPQSQPQPQPATPKRDDGEVTFSNILEFFHGIASQARDAAAGYQSTHEVRLSFQKVRLEFSNTSFAAECSVPPQSYACGREGEGESQGRACVRTHASSGPVRRAHERWT